MIAVRVGGLEEAVAGAVVRPVASDFSPVTPAMRRFADAAGPAVAEQCAQLGELPLGSAVITAAGDLPAGFIVHVAVRSATENASPGVVRTGLRNALRRIADWEIDDVALAPLGTGAGNLDAEEAAEVMMPVLLTHARESSVPFRAVIYVEDDYQKAAFEAAAGAGGGGQ
jgi:O-acetyl-ADP-ribose deacetylase (regulator of RNase III)